jgi:hypothetical protein
MDLVNEQDDIWSDPPNVKVPEAVFVFDEIVDLFHVLTLGGKAVSIDVYEVIR